jgi:hypothetical protein
MRPILYLLPSATNAVAPRTLPTSLPRAFLGGQYSKSLRPNLEFGIMD